MYSKNVLVSAIALMSISLTGCQTIHSDRTLSSEDGSRQVNQASWKKSGEVFTIPDDSMLQDDESRIIFFRVTDVNNPLSVVNINIGADKDFQVSLQEDHYSEVITCNGEQTIQAEVLDNQSGEILSNSASYDFDPQTTAYMQVTLLQMGTAIIEPVSDQAVSLLDASTRQTHQISRALSECKLSNQIIEQEPIEASPQNKNFQDKNIKIQNPTQFNVLFDFDSKAVRNSNYPELEGMANFIQSYPKMNIVLEGHTDSKGPESYNLRLSQSRANMVKDALVKNYGLEAMRLSVIGYGETMPIDTNDTVQGRQNNRRVVAVVTQVNN